MPKKNNRAKRELKPVLHIYCEGKKTEPNYLRGYINRFFSANRRLRVIEIEETDKNTPVQLVDVAIKKQSEKGFPEGDTIWVVYDRESKQKYSDDLHKKAYSEALKHSISVAFSNVCFEMWLLLHFVETNAPYSCYEDLRKKSVLREECKKRGMIDYDKGDKAIFDILKNSEIEDARNRAKKINKATQDSADPSCNKPYQWNPYTDVYTLLDEIDEHAKDKI
jgi:hypothetical protein